MLFNECLDLMTEQCRNVRLDLRTSECQHLLSLFSQSSFFVLVMICLSFFLFENENNLFMTNISLLNDEHCICFFSFPPCVFFYGEFFWFVFDLFAFCWPLLNKQWISDWCSSDTWSGEVRATRWHKLTHQR